MTTVSLITPTNVGTRDLVRAWLASALGEDLTGAIVEVDCAPMRAPTPSFLDEMVSIVLVERRAELLRLLHASDRARELANRSAGNREVAERLDIPLDPKKGALAGFLHSRR